MRVSPYKNVFSLAPERNQPLPLCPTKEMAISSNMGENLAVLNLFRIRHLSFTQPRTLKGLKANITSLLNWVD